jgi:heme exporter protein C
MYAAYLAFRRSIEDREKRAKLSAVMGILAFICVPLSYLSVQLWYTLHPIVIRPAKIAMTMPMLTTLMVALVGVMLIYLLLLKITLDASDMEERVTALKYKSR